MTKLWAGTDPVFLSALESELEAKGIRYSVRNQDLQMAKGELPPQVIWPEIWIWDEERSQEAHEILANLAR